MKADTFKETFKSCHSRINRFLGAGDGAPGFSSFSGAKRVFTYARGRRMGDGGWENESEMNGIL